MNQPGERRPVTERPRVGLVLGGGGMPGIAFHSGTLLALEHDLGWEPRSADVVVGTSAGSIVGALLRSGLSTDDLAAWSSSAAPGHGREHLRHAIDRVGAVGLRLVGPRPSVAAGSAAGLVMSALNFGILDGTQAMAELDGLLETWPADPLLVTAVRATDAQRVVFDGRSDVSVRDAVAASCAIPGVFRPVRIGGVPHVDGGVRSSTNADLLVDADVDIAVVVAPMCGVVPASRWRLDRTAAPSAAVRAWAARRLDAEVAALRTAGVETVVFRPDPATVRASGWNALGRKRTGDVAQRAFLGALDARAHDPGRLEVLEPLRSRSGAAA